MKNFLSAMAMILIINSAANAFLIDYDCSVDDIGTFQVTGFSIEQPLGSDYILDLDGIQLGDTAHFTGFFKTNSTQITIVVTEDVINQTSITWWGYKINVAMSNEFTISNPNVHQGWGATITQPEFVTEGKYQGWLGEIDFKGDRPIEFGDIASMQFNLSFEGKSDFCVTQVPNPEPASVLLLGLGSMSLLTRRRIKH